MAARRALLVVVASLVVTAGAGLARSQTVVPPGNLGFSGALQLVAPDLFLGTGLESEVGLDLNGDGDTLDTVPRLFDLATGASTFVPLASDSPQVRDGWVAVRVFEAAQGADLNGDGDQDDFVPHVFKVDAPVPVNVGVAQVGIFPMRLESGLLLVAVEEGAQGSQDLNGDGDAFDIVVQWFDLATLQLHGTGLAISGSLVNVRREAGTLAVLVREVSQGGADLNGSGTVVGDVLHLVDMASGTVRNVGLAALGSKLFSLTSGRVVCAVSETQQGVDLDGVGGAFDDIAFLVDARSAVTTNTSQIVTAFTSSSVEGRGVYLADPLSGPAGPVTPFALSRLSLAGGALVGLGRTGGLPVFSGAFGVLLVGETTVDLNGDGDTGDFVAHAYDAANGLGGNQGLAAHGVALEGDVLAVLVPESGQGGQDSNQDGDTLDTTLAVRRLGGGTPHDVPLAVAAVRAGRQHVAFSVSESAQGQTDLNGDGDATDLVLHVLDLGTGAVVNLGAAVAAAQFSFQGRLLTFLVSESDQGGLDLNGDGDAIDAVAHLIGL